MQIKSWVLKKIEFVPYRYRWVLYPIGFTLVFLLLVGMMVLLFGRKLPSLTQLEHYDPLLVTRIYSADGKVLKELYMQNREMIRLEQVPPHLIQAVLSTEDRRFFNHWGLDIPRILKAAYVNIVTFKIRQGAGTITGQLARKLYLTPERTFSRKIKEALTAIQIERTYSKQEILEMYLNHMFFENRAYGVQSAAKRYFNKSVEELTIEESALLVGILRWPARYSPYKNTEAALSRRNLVLKNMMECGYFTPAQYDSLKTLPLKVVDNPDEENATIAPYFCEYVRQMLEKKYGVGVVTDGLSVYTTLDTRVQACAEEAIQKHLPELEKQIHRRLLRSHLFQNWLKGIAPKDESEFQSLPPDSVLKDSLLVAKATLQVAFVALDPLNGHILAMVGGRDFRESKLNRAVQSKRQPGSGFKPIVYTAAIDNGYPPCLELLNQPVVIPMVDGTVWRPKNYDEDTGGLTTLRDGLKRSLNLVSIRLVQEIIPPEKVVSYAKLFGFTTEMQPYYAIALGVFDVIPLELVSAFSAFANHGVRVEPIAILKVEDKNGNTLDEAVPKRHEVMSEATAYIMTSMLKDVVDHGTGYEARRTYKFHRPAAGKTGTTNDFTDAWFIGFTPQICAGVWVGFDNPAISLGERQSGAVVALPIWAIFMKTVHNTLQLPELDFPMPGDVIWVRICKESKKLATEFCPQSMYEVFRKDLAPTEPCPLHRSPAVEMMERRNTDVF